VSAHPAGQRVNKRSWRFSKTSLFEFLFSILLWIIIQPVVVPIGGSDQLLALESFITCETQSSLDFGACRFFSFYIGPSGARPGNAAYRTWLKPLRARLVEPFALRSRTGNIDCLHRNLFLAARLDATLPASVVGGSVDAAGHGNDGCGTVASDIAPKADPNGSFIDHYHLIAFGGRIPD